MRSGRECDAATSGSDMAHVVLIESYYGGSHRAWADQWVAHSDHHIALITHPDQFWRWRLRGGAVTLAELLNAYVATSGCPDAVVISGLVNVAELTGLARSALATTPVAVYVHESQLLYPLAPNQRADSTAALANWSSLLAADVAWFNSQFHIDALRRALPSLLDAQPTPTHSHLLDRAFERSTVLWPGVGTNRLIAGTNSGNDVPRVLWNQRWDHDKNPHSVFAALAQLAADGVPFTLALAGQNQRPGTDEFEWVTNQLGDRIDHVGYLPDDRYQDLLLSSDVVVSAADHEFFGIAIVEAIAAGAVPLLPNRLSFPELIEPQWHDAVLYGEGDLRTRLRAILATMSDARDSIIGLRDSMARFDATLAAAAHDQAVNDLVALPSQPW